VSIEQASSRPEITGGRDPAEEALGPGRSSIPITFASLALILDQSGAAWLSALGTLVVSDLHLEKGSNAAARGRLIPAFDSHDTLIRLRCVIEAYRPTRVICLGDSFHDGRAGERMAEADRQELASLCAAVEEWVWISGNHDPEAPEFCRGERRRYLPINGVTLRHEPSADREAPEIAGHFHPKASVPAVGHRFSGRCFCISDDLLIMPAFGAYTGGLHCAAKELRSLHRADPKIFMLYASKIWRVS
jgi:DNA ligase-associated metallophosphoesterase